MSIIGIVAIDKNNAIGKGGRLPWHYSADLRFFKQQTTGNACVMGHHTWLALNKPLPQRLNIVLSRSSDIDARESLIVMRNKPAVLSLVPYLSCDIYIIGGAQIYGTFLDVIDKWIVTQIPLEVDGADAFMPDDFLRGFDVTETKILEDGLAVTVYKRVASAV